MSGKTETQTNINVMKKLFLTLGLASAILMSSAFAQIMQKQASIAVPLGAKTVGVKAQAQQAKNMDSRIAEKFGINENRKKSTAPFKKTSSLRHIATYASNPEKVMIKLVVGEAWLDGNGYQLLFDADAKLCDSAFPGFVPSARVEECYAMADYTIPANASPTDITSVVRDFESDSAEIEPGVYDVLCVNPSMHSSGLYVEIPGGSSQVNDFVFQKGFTYVFEVEDGDLDVEVSIKGPFDLALENIELPMSCELEDEVEIKLAISNNGAIDAENLNLWYCIAREDDPFAVPDTIKQTFTGTLEAGKTQTYTFSNKLTQIKEGILYSVYAGVVPFAEESYVEDNSSVASFVKKAGLDQLPYIFDLGDYGFYPSTPTSWWYDEDAEGAYIEGDFEPGHPLISRCFELEGDKAYRLSYDYWAGFEFIGYPIPESYHVGFGLVSEPISTWDTLLKEEGVYISGKKAMDLFLTPKTTGTYALYFSSDLAGFVGIQNVKITEIADKDACLSSFDLGVARLMPVKQLSEGLTAAVKVQNRGGLSIAEATVKVTMNGTEVGSAKVENLASSKESELNIPLSINNFEIGDKCEFVATVELAGEAESELKDNTQTFQMDVSDYVMAYDHVADNMYNDDYAIGANFPVGCGLPFTLIKKDTITAVSLGWNALEVNMTVGIRIEKWNKEEQTLGDMVYQTEVSRGMAAGQREYKMPSIILEAGDYMISVHQLNSNSFGLITDLMPGNGFYTLVDDYIGYQDDLGTPSIRAVFGPDAAPMAKDIAVVEITKPNVNGLFAENQEVVVVVSNQGYEEAQAPISLMVNGSLVATETVDFAPYSRKEVSFIANLSSPDTEYVLTVFSALEGDADPTNDTCTKTIKSLPPADPYVMDFEYCEDFVIEGFVPAWKTVDMDKTESYGMEGLDFPHMNEAFAFIAFNPSALGFEDEAIAPHGGERFGAAMAAIEGVNSDWLISPKLKIDEGYVLTFFVKSLTGEYGLERYNVLVSTTDDNVASFTKIEDNRRAPAEAWEKVSFDLKEYVGKEIHLAIQCVSIDTYMFMIDDISVGKGTVANESAVRLENRLSLYPNPAREMIVIHAKDATINRVDVFNVAGTMVYQSNALNTTDYRYSVKGLNAGVYFARVATDKGTTVMKFVVR